MLALQPWVDLTIVVNFAHLKTACLNASPAACEGIDCQNIKKITLCVHPYIEAFITKGFFWKSLLHKWKKTTGGKITVRGMASYGFMEFKFFNELEDEIIV